MVIRLARKDEVKKLQVLNDEIFIDNPKYDSDLKRNWGQSKAGEDYFTGTLNNSDYICLIAEDNGKPVGYIAAGPKNFDYRLSKYIEVENIGVSPDYHSKGIGAQLLKKCLNLAKKKGYQKAYVNAYFDNKDAVALFERSGFKKIDISLERNI